MNNISPLQHTSTYLIASLMFVLIILFNLAGHMFRLRMIRLNPEHRKVELGTINGILLGLLGLLLAFTFNMANSRYDKRRDLVIAEANNIGTAILRADLYPDSTRQMLRENFKKYLEARIAFYQAGTDIPLIIKHFLEADSLGKVLWKIAVTDVRENNIVARSAQMIPALNAMIDITTTRRSAGESTIPKSIMFFLFSLALCAAFLVGYDTKGMADRIIVFGFATILSITVFMIVDLDRPRSGLINLDVANEKIIELRSMFNQP